MRKILVFQTWGIGDMIMSTPMLSSLRKKLPRAEITVIAGSRASADVIEGSHLCNEVQILPLGGNSFYHHKIGYSQIFKSFYGYRKEIFDAAVVCTRISTYVPLLLKTISGIDIISGDGVGKRGFGYSSWCPVEPTLHRVICNLKILQAIFPDTTSSEVYFHIDKKSSNQADGLWREWGLVNKKVIGIHFGSGPLFSAKKRIPTDLCRRIILDLLNNYPDARIIVMLGPFEKELFASLDLQDKRIFLAEDLSLRVIGGLIARMNTLLAGDTSLGHVASALNIPVVTLAGPTEIHATKPWGVNNKIIMTDEYLSCMPCFNSETQRDCPHQNRCMRTISPIRVVDAIAKWL